jgi:hypothetical protein
MMIFCKNTDVLGLAQVIATISDCRRLGRLRGGDFGMASMPTSEGQYIVFDAFPRTPSAATADRFLFIAL